MVPSSTKALRTRRWQNGNICNALTTEAVTSFCQTHDGAMCSRLPWHHRLQPPHVHDHLNKACSPQKRSGEQYCFLPPFPCTWVAFSRPSSRYIPSSWPGTAPFTLLPSDATGKSLLRWRLALAQEAVRGTFFTFPSSPWLPRISTVCIFVARVPSCLG